VTTTERTFLLAPGPIARAAAWMAGEAEQRWMLSQPREVRRSYVTDVVDRPTEPHATEAWMLRQEDAVRDSYVAEVLAERLPASRQEIWMLGQKKAVRASYVRDVLEAD
jgi:hypothetical protein